jgi:hypothetical protein
MLRSTTNMTPGKLRRFARQRGLSLDQLNALVRLLGCDPPALDAAIARLRGHSTNVNDNIPDYRRN